MYDGDVGYGCYDIGDADVDGSGYGDYDNGDYDEGDGGDDDVHKW